jgi:hypothetical protein
MKRYYITKDGQYLNYIFCFNELLKLKSTSLRVNKYRVARRQSHIIYTEKQANRVLLIEKDAILVPIED